MKVPEEKRKCEERKESGQLENEKKRKNGRECENLPFGEYLTLPYDKILFWGKVKYPQNKQKG